MIENAARRRAQGALAVAAFAVIFLAGCGGDSADKTEPESVTAPAPAAAVAGDSSAEPPSQKPEGKPATQAMDRKRPGPKTDGGAKNASPGQGLARTLERAEKQGLKVVRSDNRGSGSVAKILEQLEGKSGSDSEEPRGGGGVEQIIKELTRR